MTQIKMKNLAVPYNGGWSPAVQLGESEPHLVSHQGRIIQYETEAEAKAYFDDEE